MSDIKVLVDWNEVTFLIFSCLAFNFKMIADGYLVGDGSWELHVLVTDLQVERTLRVKGDLHIGGLMLNLVEELGM